jgi:hypothetical protein
MDGVADEISKTLHEARLKIKPKDDEDSSLSKTEK